MNLDPNAEAFIQGAGDAAEPFSRNSMPPPNVVRMQADVDEEREEAKEEEDASVRGVHHPGQGVTRVFTQDLRRFIRSKDDIY